MLKRILIVWFVANFFVVGAVCILAGGWYLGWSPLAVVLAELGLIMLPNLLLPILTLRHGWPRPVDDMRAALGWRWNGWRSILVGAAAFLLAFALSAAIANLIGGSIP